MDDFKIEDGTIIKYIGREENVVIPDGVTAVAPRAFYECDTIRSLTIPESVRSFGKEAFHYCKRLKKVYAPSLEYWLSASFEGFASNPLFHDASLFLAGEKLVDLVVPPNTKEITCEMFNGCKSLESVAFSKKATGVTKVEIVRCKSLRSVELPDGVEEICFSGCTNLPQIAIPSSVKVFGRNAFELCHTLETIDIPESVKTIKRGAFRKCASLKELVIPDGVGSIDAQSFEGCDSLVSLVISKRTKLKWSALFGSEYYRFPRLERLETLALPDNLGVGELELSFSGCKSLKRIIYRGTALPKGLSVEPRVVLIAPNISVADLNTKLVGKINVAAGCAIYGASHPDYRINEATAKYMKAQFPKICELLDYEAAPIEWIAKNGLVTAAAAKKVADLCRSRGKEEVASVLEETDIPKSSSGVVVASEAKRPSASAKEVSNGDEREMLRNETTLDCRSGELDSPTYKMLKPGTRLKFSSIKPGYLEIGGVSIGRVDEKRLVAIEPFLEEGVASAEIVSAKGGTRKPAIVVNLLIPKNDNPRYEERLIIGKDGSFKPRPAFVNGLIETRHAEAAKAAEAEATKKREANRRPPMNVKEEDVEILDKYAGEFPMLVETGGGNSMSKYGIEMVEALTPGDPVELKIDYAAYGRYYMAGEIPYVFIKGANTALYLKFGLAEDEKMQEVSQLIPYIQASVQEMVPVSLRAKTAKSPKLVVRLDLDYDTLNFPD